MTSVLYQGTLGTALLSLALGLLGCQAQSPSEAGSISTEPAKANVDRITYVDSAGNLFTIKADGSELQQLTGATRVQSGPTGRFMSQGLDFNVIHAWPTWSPDGTKLAASRVRVSGDRDAEITVQVLDTVTGRSRTVFSNDFAGLVADGSPHYLYWSPDSQSLSLLSSTSTGLGLFVVNTESTEAPIVVERGAPLYYSWAGDGNSLLVHIGEEVKLFRELSDHASGEVLATARGFRVPAFSPDSKRVAYLAPTESGESLFVAEISALANPRQVLELGAFSAFIWSPDGTELAVVDQQQANSVVFQRLRVVSADGSLVHTVTEDPLLAFYWSPNGERIAWVAINREQRTFEWRLSPRNSTDFTQTRSLFSFNPSRDVLTMLTYFDQYSYSHSPWSPDSTRLVVAGTQVAPFERRNGHTPTGARVFVIDAAGNTPPQDIAEGILAFWSWN